MGSFGQSLEFRSSEKQVHLLELYSSEGCSSCPPADKWLASLMNHPKLWKEVVPLKFHVDYWNRLGWHDPFSQKKFTDRQKSLAALWYSRTIYTPGFSLNAKEWRVYKGFPSSVSKVGVLVAEKKAHMLYLSFKPTFVIPKAFEVHVALLAHGLQTKVLAGENKGELLKHEFVVLDIKTTELKKASGS